MSADKCPVCGSEFIGDDELIEWECGKSQAFGRICPNAERLAIERAAQIETLKAEIERMKKEMT